MSKEIEKYLLEIGFDVSHLPNLFNDSDKSWYTIPELINGYSETQAKEIEQQRTLLNVCNGVGVANMLQENTNLKEQLKASEERIAELSRLCNNTNNI